MRALCWYGKRDIRVEEVEDPAIINPKDAIIAVTSSGICGSDLHLWNGHIPSMRAGDIVGHEAVGEVVEVGHGVEKLEPGDRVVVPFPIACGECWNCKREEWSLCDNSNPNASMAKKVFGHSPSAVFGSSHLLGGYAGCQAEYVRVPFADVGCLEVDHSLHDEKALLLSDTLPTAYMAVEQAEIEPGDVVAIWGCGPVGQLSIRCATLFEPSKIIAIDEGLLRLRMARDQGGAEVIDGSAGHEVVRSALDEMTGGRGPDVVIDASGIEADGHGVGAFLGKRRGPKGFETAYPESLREAIMACRKGGRVSIPGAYASLIDTVPLGAAAGKALSFRMGRAHVHRYMRPLLERIESGALDPSFVITHRLVLSDAPSAYELFDEGNGCVKVLLEP